MKLIKCKWEMDTTGFYILPFIAFGNEAGGPKALWLGWLYWLWTIQLTA